jgi:hypothetical protein
MVMMMMMMMMIIIIIIIIIIQNNCGKSLIRKEHLFPVTSNIAESGLYLTSEVFKYESFIST